MKIKVDRRNLKKEEVDTAELVSLLSTGKAVMFTGAGFSKCTKDVSDKDPSMAKDLAKEICRLGEFPEDDDLRFATDYYLQVGEKSDLISLLKKKYTLKNTDRTHDNICKINWRRIYTTNYDKSVEIASANVGKVVECVDTNYPTTEYYKRESLCIHLNGSIDSLTEETIEESFKLSTSSYISPESFTESDWYYYFKKDLERASAIVFVGYSMYDIEIQKTLFENQELKEKTYFITRKNPDQKTEFTLSRFGYILPIGVDGFSNLIDKHSEEIFDDSPETELQSLVRYEVSHESVEVKDADVETMIMYGDISNHLIDDGVIGEQRIPYLILRDCLSDAKRFVENGENLIFYGDLGNGKSILLRELQSVLSIGPTDVYYIYDFEGDYIGDIDLLARSGKKTVICIDGYERYFDILKHYCNSAPSNIVIVATARIAEHERMRQDLKRIGFNYNEVSLDILTDCESSRLVDIIDNLGMWREKAGLSHENKTKHIKLRNSSQISLALLDLFNSPQIKTKVSSELKSLLLGDDHKDTVFSIALINVLDIPCKFSLVSDIAGCDLIYKSSLKGNENFRNLFKPEDLEVKAKSSLFCLSLIRDHFPPSYVIKKLQAIAKLLDRREDKGYEHTRIFKSALRFSFVERVLPEENKKNNLRGYYQNLKVIVPWLKNDPHFWLQYAMANMPFKEYGKAQQYLDQAYSLAHKKAGYYTSNIDTQQARLHLLVSIQERDDAAKMYAGFEKCHNLLRKLENDIYKFRQVEKYRDFYESCYSKLSRKNQNAFQHACRSMLNAIETGVEDRELNLSGQGSVIKAKTNLDYVVSHFV
ncbi:SIR2 family protein [Lacimicrobium alkaliphilum]|uniref:Uncharacterized protein n=1 Tax=Lacimicrobium alkaliphilum TaxID=1526571 RepID=A0A0U3B0P0_9ALTE|nr:SIR2 family protein [Lacimicrobium alkaliphilum]ALS98840.1 hypothetical protein AT746_11540 [Lacimicrobium alkaliphilum]